MSGERDAQDPQSKDYMWVYHSPGIQDSQKIYLYEYDNGSRSAAVIDRYLEGYKGILVSDGYASCHTLDRKHDDLKVAGCWVHCKRKYAEIVKTAKKELQYLLHNRLPGRLRKGLPLFSIQTISARANYHRRFLTTDSNQ